MLCVFPVAANRVTNCLAGSFVDASQRGIKVLLGLCVTLGTYQTWTGGVFHFRANLVKKNFHNYG
jgi:hypothetical protein